MSANSIEIWPKIQFCSRDQITIYSKKKWQASTTTHDLFVNNLKISPTFICRGEVPSNTFAKLPVHVLINDPKNWTQKVHYSHKPIIWSCDLLPQVETTEKRDRHQLVPMTHFQTTSTFDLLSYIEEKCLQTHLQSFLCVLINDLKKLDKKSSLQLKTHHLVMWPTSTRRPKCFRTFLKLPVSALINDPPKKGMGIN